MENAKEGEASSPIKGEEVLRAGFFLSLCSHRLARVMGRVMELYRRSGLGPKLLRALLAWL